MPRMPRIDLLTAGGRTRCGWPGDDPLYVAYHDDEWGVPEHDPRALYEKLVLDGFQAGLSWITILRKRDAFRRRFARFQPRRVARWTDADVATALTDPGIVRHRGKIEGAVRNARAFLALADAGVDFDAFVWDVVDGRTRVNRFRRLADVPAESAESRALSRKLRDADFVFVGPTICYAFMQAVGMVDDHLLGCFRRDADARRGTATGRRRQR